MAKTNVVVINSEKHTSTLAFDHIGSLVSFIANFVDDHDGWAVKFELVLVHKNNKVLRYRGRVLQDLITLAYGLQVADWLVTGEGEIPTANYMDWLDKDRITKVFDSKEDDDDLFDEDPYSRAGIPHSKDLLAD